MSATDIPLTYKAAGGVVTDDTGEQVLLLVRPSRDEVRLPKGHIDPGETPQIAALREVTEETGYDDLETLAHLGEQLVAFALGNRKIQRHETLFLMRARTRHEIERPEEDEQQFFSVWASWDEAVRFLTFESEREWVRRARSVLDSMT